MWIKICGNTRLEDCQRAAELGADAVGFVFAAGRRTVTAQQVEPSLHTCPQRLRRSASSRRVARKRSLLLRGKQG